jgi:PAS domain S-box-containing protein
MTLTEPTLLIVDDDPGTCETLSDIFQEKGYTVATATTGREAQDKAKQTAFNVALIDIRLPDVDGTALLTEFRKTHPDMVCMIITGHASVQNAISALEDGANGYFVKPLILEEIVHRVEETVDKQRLVREKRQAEEALQRSEKRFRDIAENAFEWIWEIDANGKYTYASPVAEKILGYKPEELLKKHFHDLFHPEDREERKKAAFEVFAKKQPYREFLNQNVHKNGRTVLLSTSGVPVLDDEGNLLGYRGADVDITERKRAEEELAKERDYTRHLIDSSPDFQMTLDKDGRIMDVTEAFEHEVGKSREELIGSSSYEYLPKEETKKLIAEIFEKEKVRDIELTANIPGKEALIWNFSGSVFTIREEELGCYVTGRDITEQRRAQETLRDSEERKELALRGADLATWDWNLQTGECLHDKRWAEMFGYTLDELEQHIRTWENMVHPDDMPLVIEALNAHVEGKTPFYETEHRCRHKSGEWIWVLDKGKVIEWDSNGKALRATGTLQDITKRKLAEAQIKASLKEKVVLLREIHHRVKNNLQIISSLLSMQARKAKDENVIVSLLDSRSRIQTMSLIHAQLYQSENLEQVEMGITIRNLVSFMLQLYADAKKNIESVVTAEGVILSISQAIPCGLIINELVSNALKHAFKGMTEGSIEISIRELAGDKIKLTVKDNGVGIPEELDIYKTDTLGLKLVRTLAEEQLKGKMGLIREKGTGIYVEFDKSIMN